MSEDKIMDIIKGKLLMIEKMLKQDDEEGHTSAYEMQFEDFEAIQGLLDLYQKEKEKNKELEKIKFIITDKLPPDMKYVCYCNTDFERLFGNDYISKDKIKRKIKIRKEEKAECKDSIEANLILREIYALEELLEERN